MPVQCHYEVLSIPQDADATTIKKAYRKLALKYHPDKNPNNDEATHQFRLIQSAYECLSDEKERKWYDEHREAILRGWDGNNGGDGVDKEGVVFDVVPYQFGGCYDGYNDDADGFYAVYTHVFTELYKCELHQWTSMGNIDESTFPLAHFCHEDTPFGDSGSDYTTIVSQFYACWESYTTVCKYAWVDDYDVREAPNRRIRRAMEEENTKKRRAARKERNEEVLSLVRFVKRRDPRVKRRLQEVKEEQRRKEVERKKDLERRKSEAAVAREAWREEAERMREELARSDAQAGKVRLADLDSEDDEDYDYGGKKKKNRRKSKKNKKNTKPNKKKHRHVEEEEDDESSQEDAKHKNDETNPDPNEAEQTKDEPIKNDHSTSSEEEEEEEVYRCEVCKKDFKSHGQLKNHLTSKKHREAFKKYEKKQSILLEQQRRLEEEEERNKKKVAEEQSDDDEEEEEEEESVEDLEQDEAMAELLEEMALESKDEEDSSSETASQQAHSDDSTSGSDNDQNETPPPSFTTFHYDESSSSSSSSSEEEEEEEPEYYRCQCCKKDFKSSGQLENHFKSKKHREAFKKYEKKQKQNR